jgi:Ssp1 endopeptidase immunity protein Rap1a
MIRGITKVGHLFATGGVAALIALIITATLQPVAVAGLKTGNDILMECASKAAVVDHGYCFGYISGIADAMGAEDSIFGWRACFPKGATFGQAEDATLRYLQVHIGGRQKDAASLVAAALAEAFPCR